MEYFTIKDFCFEQQRYKEAMASGDGKIANLEKFKELCTPKISKFQCLPQALLVKLTKEYIDSELFFTNDDIEEYDIFLFVGEVAQSPKKCIIQKIGDGYTLIVNTDDVEVLYFHKDLAHENIS